MRLHCVFTYFLMAGVLIAGPAIGRDFPSIMAEPNLEKRSELALVEADKALSAAKTAYHESVEPGFSEGLSDVKELVSLSYQSLRDTGKKARRSPKFFKRAEIKVRLLLRRLDTMVSEVDLERRPTVETTKELVARVHDSLINDLMTSR